MGCHKFLVQGLASLGAAAIDMPRSFWDNVLQVIFIEQPIDVESE